MKGFIKNVKQRCNRDFSLLLIGESVSLIGDRMLKVALIWLSYKLTESALLVGVVATCTTIPYIIVSIYAGVIVDKVEKKKIMIASDIARGIIVLVIPLIYYVGELQIWHIAVTAFLLSSFDQFFNPAYKAFIPLLVKKDKLLAANANVSLIEQLSKIIGPALVGIMVFFVSEMFFFILDSLTFFVSALALFFIRTNETICVENKKKKVRKHIKGAFQYLKKDNEVRILIIIGMVINFFLAGIIIVLTPIFSKTISTNYAQVYATILSAYAVGTLISSVILQMFKKIDTNYLFMISFILGGISFIGIGFVKVPVVIYIFFALAGMMIGFINISFATNLQRKVEHNKRGVVFSLVSMTSMGLTPISHLLVGVLADYLKPFVFYLVLGFIMLICGFAYSYFKKNNTESSDLRIAN